MVIQHSAREAGGTDREFVIDQGDGLSAVDAARVKVAGAGLQVACALEIPLASARVTSGKTPSASVR